MINWLRASLIIKVCCQYLMMYEGIPVMFDVINQAIGKKKKKPDLFCTDWNLNLGMAKSIHRSVTSNVPIKQQLDYFVYCTLSG